MTSTTAEQIVLLELISRRVTDALKAAKDRALAEMDPGDRQTAALVSDAGRAKIGAVTLTDPTPKPRVVDRAKFVAWVEEHRPDAIETIKSVRKAYEDVLLKTGATEDGELIPGVDIVQGNTVLQVRPEKNAADLLAEHLTRSGLSMSELLDSLDLPQIGD